MANLLVFKGDLDALSHQVVGHGGLVVVDFHATWCPSCRYLGQLLPSIAAENEKVLFLKIDVDDAKALAAHFEITSIPNVKYFKALPNGALSELGSVIGANMTEIKAKIAEFDK